MRTPTWKNIQKKFKIRGYKLKVEAAEEVMVFVNLLNHDENEAINLLLDELEHEDLKSAPLDKESVHRAAALLLNAEAAPEESYSSVSRQSALRIIDAFLIPKYCYNPVKKIFYEYSKRILVHSTASEKTALYKDRYLLLFQRLSRDKHFSKPIFENEDSELGSWEISPIQSLIGERGRKWVMGVISQLEDGHFFLEDLTASVEINLSNAKITTGLFSENTIVVAEGEMLLEGIFQVRTCGFPPLEEREVSLKLLGGLDFFGSGVLTKDESSRLESLQMNAMSDMFVILSDIWLDNEETMLKLQKVLDGYENVEVVPSLFVFMGNFCSCPCNLAFNSFSTLRMKFERMGEMLGLHTRLKEQSTFLFIPGPDDIGPSTALPRVALPRYFTEEIQKHIPNAVFISNPCRVKFYTQEIVFFRHDLLYKMRRACLLPPTTEETNDSFEHLVATIAHQSHLCPLPLTVQPIIWSYDHCFHLYPTPHTIVLGDRSEQKVFKYGGVTCFNPGSFSEDGTFAAYRPCSQEVELSSL